LFEAKGFKINICIFTFLCSRGAHAAQALALRERLRYAF
jgi:hypothetical protein